MKNNYLLAMLVALIFVSCSKSEDPFVPANVSKETAKSEVLNKREKHEDISGTLTYQRQNTFNISCGDHWAEGYFTDGDYSGTGDIEGLGDITSKTEAWATQIYSESKGPGVHVGYQCLSFFDEDGDELILTTDGYDLFFNQYGVAVGECKFDFAGGTGRYKKAKGSFTGQVANPLQGSFTVKIEGEISY